MAALSASSDAEPLLRGGVEAGLGASAPPSEVASAVALPLSAWAIHSEPPMPAPGAPAKADPLQDEYAAAAATYQGAPAPAPSAPPAALGPYVPGQPLPGAPASGAFYPAPLAAAAAAPLSAGPPLQAPALGCWGVCAMAFNTAVLVLLLCVALDVSGARQPLGAAAGGAYLVYLVLCLCSPSAKALRNSMGSRELLAHTHAVRAARPEVWAAIECWHNETRTRHVTETDKDGKTHRRRETYTERVVTHRARGTWGYRGCRDISGEPVYQPYLPMLEVHFKPCVVRAPRLPGPPLPALTPHPARTHTRARARAAGCKTFWTKTPFRPGTAGASFFGTSTGATCTRTRPAA